MDNIDYSVIIRTTGCAHTKYQKLLDSIARLEPAAKEVIVVLPEGYDLPQERLGWETFIYCPKGMVRQRVTGIEACQTDYALICDDDVYFSSDFVKKLHNPIKQGRCAFSAAPLYSFLPEKGKETLICTMMASAVPTLFHRRNRYVSILRSTGYSYNRHLDRSRTRFYESQSVPWTCFYADVQALKRLKLNEEFWLDLHGYSALDDQTMFYKAWLMGLKTVVVSDAFYKHLDAKTSTHNNKPAVLYSRAYNRVVFWHRFIFLQQLSWVGKGLSLIAFIYYLLWDEMWNVVSVIRHRMTLNDCIIHQNGLCDAIKFIRSDEYHVLPPVSRR